MKWISTPPKGPGIYRARTVGKIINAGWTYEAYSAWDGARWYVFDISVKVARHEYEMKRASGQKWEHLEPMVAPLEKPRLSHERIERNWTKRQVLDRKLVLL